MYRKLQFQNGLRLVSHDISNRHSVALGFWVGVGGRYEPDRIKGAAHFLEHIVFKGCRKYSGSEIKEKIEGVGGTLNAFTSEEQTCFFAKIPAKHIVSTFDILADMVFYPRFTIKDFDKEKTVIIEEIKMYHDLPQYHVIELLDGLLWPNHPLGKSLAGTFGSISKMSKKNLIDFHKTHYTANNIVVSLCGRFDQKQISRLVHSKTKKIIAGCKDDYVKVTYQQNEPKAVFNHRSIEQMHLALGVEGFHENHPDRYILGLLNVILGGNMSSRLFVELREKRGWAYSVSSIAKTLHDTGVFMIRAGVHNNRIVDAIGLIIKELKKIKRNGVSQDEFKRAREYLLGQLLLGLEDPMEEMLWLGEEMISKNKIKTMNQVIDEFQRIKKRDIQRVAEIIFDERKFNLAVIGPIQDKQKRDISSVMGIK